MKEKLLHNVGLKLFSLILAFSLWLVVAGEQRVEQALKVPIKLTDLPVTLALANEPDGFVTVRMRGPKTLVSGLGPDDINLELELSRLKEGEHVVPLRADQVGVPRGVEVVQVAPARLRVVLEPVAEQEVRVVPRVDGKPASGHYLKRTYARPERVRVVGPRSEVNRVGRVYSSPVSIEGRSADFAVKSPIEPPGRSLKLAGSSSVEVVVEIRERGRR
jgi:YbbR domain-containing protein